jgi:hypothetical protein
MKAGVKPGDVIAVNGDISLVFDGTHEGIDVAHVVDSRGRHGPLRPLVALSVHGPWTAPGKRDAVVVKSLDRPVLGTLGRRPGEPGD